MRLIALAFLSLAAAIFPLLLNAGNESPEKELRVISLSPSMTEIIFQLGRGKWLKGRDVSSNYPAEVLSVPVAGNFADANAEQLVSLRPDIVLTCDLKNPSLKDSLAALGVKCVVLKIESIDQYLAAVKEIGEILSCQEAAKKEISRVQSAIAVVSAKTEKIPQDKRPLVYFEIWDAPLMTAGKCSFINEYISIAGGRNIAAGTEKDYFSCSPELVISSSPEIIICPGMAKVQAADNFARRSGWDKIPAVVNKRIYPELSPDILFRPGPRITEAIEIIYNCIHKQAE